MVETLNRDRVDTRHVRVGPSATGQAIVQVDDAGENAIVVSGGANHELTGEQLERALAAAPSGSWLLVQNETNCVAQAIRLAHDRGMPVALNPAPFDDSVREYPLELVHLLCVNRAEGSALTGQASAEGIIAALGDRLADCEILLTLGAAGAWYRCGRNELRETALEVDVVDTTAAGDTFFGYFLAGRAAGLRQRECLVRATRAAALCVARRGAIASIPRADEVERFGRSGEHRGSRRLRPAD